MKYRIGEGITGRVVQSGQPVVVPRASSEPMFLQRASKRPELPREEISYVCVPILLNRKAVGALGVDFRFKPDRDFDRTVKFLGVVASMLAQAIKIQRLIDAERRRLEDENTHLRQELRERYDFSNILGTSGPMRQVYEQVAQVARTNTTVLIRGESGTGKELIAHAIHYNSLRAKKPFVKVSCAALPETPDRVRAVRLRKGRVHRRRGARRRGGSSSPKAARCSSTRSASINLTTQIKLLRVLQEREFERLGGTETIKPNVRLIAATNKDLEKAIADGTFREDLYYRLNVFTIFVPPLRERKADMLLLADHFLEKLSREHRQEHQAHLDAGHRHADGYHWPGNVRELENAIERAVVVCDGQVVHAHHLPPTLQTAASSGTVDEPVAERRDRRVREGPDSGRAEDGARQPREGGAPAEHDRAHHELQGPPARHRLAPVQEVTRKREPVAYDRQLDQHADASTSLSPRPLPISSASKPRQITSSEMAARKFGELGLRPPHHRGKFRNRQ